MKYTINLDSNFASPVGATVLNTSTNHSTSKGLYYGASAVTSITVPARRGYTFNGYETNTGITLFDKNGAWALAKTHASYADYLDANGRWVYPNNLDLKASWVATDYSVIFNANGGSNGGTAIFTYDQPINTQTAYKPVRTGYIFNGSYDAIRGGTTVFVESMN